MDGMTGGSMFEFGVETFDDVIAEIEPILRRHYETVALHQEAVPLDPDYGRYRAIERAGAMLICTVRFRSATVRPLVGYAVYLIFPHLHHRSTLWALSDIFWIDPEMRRPGVSTRLFAFAEAELCRRKVTVMKTNFKVAIPDIGRVLDHLGHELVEHGYAKVLAKE